MKLTDALNSIQRLGFDTAPLIYLVEKHPANFDRMFLIMQSVDSNLISGVASTIALTEVLVQPLRVGDRDLVNRYVAVMSRSRNFSLIPISTAIARRAADIRAHHHLQTPDALHVATAIEAGCDAFLTNDRGIQRVTEIRVLVLDDLEIDQ